VATAGNVIPKRGKDEKDCVIYWKLNYEPLLFICYMLSFKRCYTLK
jgi:hypothetical protein